MERNSFMSKKIIRTDKASLPVGPYNQAVAIGNLVYTAGQIPLDKQGNMVPGGVKEQTEAVIQNLIAVLGEAGSSLDKAVKATVFLKDLNDFAGMNEVYAKYFKAETAPARTTIQVARIPKDSLVEIEVVAII
jgi:2-iminobutanoate/2-iminopropanoate deaminase